jgi:hypothetical protein
VRYRACVLFGCCLAAAACSRKSSAPKPIASNALSSSLAPPLDHLAPDELAEGKLEVYGFPVPRGMDVESRLVDRAYVRGRVSPEALANYVREHVAVSHVEIGAARTVFPMARIKNGPKDRYFTIEVYADGPSTRLVLKDTTPPPPPPPGLSDAERWRAAGYSPDGRPLDPSKLE